jgi:PPOX class probable FMN-dependent enzyme
MDIIESEDELRRLYTHAEGLAAQKPRPSIDKYSRQFIEMSPFLVIATSNAQGKADVSPRGDPPGFVQIIDEKTLLIPDRPGNNRLDTMVNITENPNVAALFFIPGFEDTLRLSGRARITDDAALLSRCTVNGKVPKTGILITVDEVFLHCAKALRRSKLWQDDYKQDRSQMPSIARIILEQTCDSGVDEAVAAAKDSEVEENYRNEMY